jgi:hypothetical protein
MWKKPLIQYFEFDYFVAGGVGNQIEGTPA